MDGCMATTFFPKSVAAEPSDKAVFLNKVTKLLFPSVPLIVPKSCLSSVVSEVNRPDHRNVQLPVHSANDGKLAKFRDRLLQQLHSLRRHRHEVEKPICTALSTADLIR